MQFRGCLKTRHSQEENDIKTPHGTWEQAWAAYTTLFPLHKEATCPDTYTPVDRSFHSPLITVKETKLRMPKRQVLGFKSQLCHFPAVQPEASVITCLRRHFLRETALPW